MNDRGTVRMRGFLCQVMACSKQRKRNREEISVSFLLFGFDDRKRILGGELALEIQIACFNRFVVPFEETALS